MVHWQLMGSAGEGNQPTTFLPSPLLTCSCMEMVQGRAENRGRVLDQ
jgi:hypothetical protein